jgi:WD40 repeat protein
MPALTGVPINRSISVGTAGQVELLSTLSGHGKTVFSVIFAADVDFLASASPDRTIRLWKIPSGQEEHTFNITEVGTDNIAFSPDGNLLASSEAIWDVKSKHLINSIDLGIYGPVDFSPDSSILAVANLGHPIKLWDVASGEVLRALDNSADNIYHSIEFSPDGKLLAAGGHLNGTVTLWDVENGKVVRTYAHDTRSNFHGVAFSPDGKLLASAATEGTTKLWDVSNGQLVLTLTAGNGCYDVTFTPYGSLLATDGCGPTVKLWDAESGELLRTLRHDDEVMAVDFSSDSTLLASGCYDNQVYLWGIHP